MEGVMRLLPILFLSIWLGILPGCASKYGDQHTAVNYYPACYRPIQDLRDNEHNVGKSTGIGAGIGAVGGALIGLLATGKWQGAVMGAAVGGAGGAMVGNAYGSKQQERDDNVRLASYLQDIDGDISKLDVVSAAATNSLQCYDRQFQILLAAIKARQITREAAAQRYAEIQSGREEAIAILGNAYQHGNTMAQDYENAFINEQKQIQTPQKMAKGPVALQQKQRAIAQGRQRNQALIRKTSSIQQKRDTALADSSRQTREINEAYAALSDIRS